MRMRRNVNRNVFVIEYQLFLCLNWKSQKGTYLYFIFELYLKGICKYNQIHIKMSILPTKGNALPYINWLRSLGRMFFMPVIWSTVGRQHWENWPRVKLVKHIQMLRRDDHVWNAMALCIPSQGSCGQVHDTLPSQNHTHFRVNNT